MEVNQLEISRQKNNDKQERNQREVPKESRRIKSTTYKTTISSPQEKLVGKSQRIPYSRDHLKIKIQNFVSPRPKAFDSFDFCKEQHQRGHYFYVQLTSRPPLGFFHPWHLKVQSEDGNREEKLGLFELKVSHKFLLQFLVSFLFLRICRWRADRSEEKGDEDFDRREERGEAGR